MYTSMAGFYLLIKATYSDTSFCLSLKRQNNLMIFYSFAHPITFLQKVSLRMIHYAVCVVKNCHISETLQYDIGLVL